MEDGFSGSYAEWKSSINGLSAYELAVEKDGFSGSYIEWRDSLKGEKGETGKSGEDGSPGASIFVAGTLSSIDDLPMSNNSRGDAYIIDENFWVWDGSDWEDVGFIQGPKGQKGDQGEPGKEGLQGRPGPQGPQGPEGPAGPEGPEGPMGASIRILGTYDSVEEIPAINHLSGDAYVIQGKVFVWDTSKWVDVGLFQGPQGEEGPQGEQGPEGPVGPEGPEGPEGPQGEVGEPGPGLIARGVLESTSELPSEDNVRGDAYIVGPMLYIWNDVTWVNMGVVKGERGNDGPEGPEGPEGPQGPRGPLGNSWLSFPRDPSAVDGNENDFAINSVTNDFFRKLDSIGWAKMGRLGGGTVEEAPLDGIQYVREGGVWSPSKAGISEAPTDGRMYVRQEARWTSFEPELRDVDQEGVFQRSKDGWVKNTLLEAPSDGGLYLRRNRKWVGLDRYTLKNEEVEDIMDLSMYQTFSIVADRDKTLTMTNRPTKERTMTVVVTIVNSDGIITWPDNVYFKDDIPPTLGDNFTVVVLYWTGSIWIGKLVEAL